MAIELAPKQYYLASAIPNGTFEWPGIWLCRDARTGEYYWSHKANELVLLPDGEELWQLVSQEQKASIDRFTAEHDAWTSSPDRLTHGWLGRPSRSTCRLWVMEYNTDPDNPVNIDQPWFFYSLPPERDPRLEVAHT